MVAVNENKHFLIIRLSGPAVRAGRIPVSQLLRLFFELNKVLNRVGRVLAGEIAFYEKGAFSRVQKRIQGPVLNIRTVEGRLLMADFERNELPGPVSRGSDEYLPRYCQEEK